mgnify:FL=1
MATIPLLCRPLGLRLAVATHTIQMPRPAQKSASVNDSIPSLLGSR